MAHPIIFDGEIHREMTDAEFTQYQIDVATHQAAEQARLDAEAARVSARGKLIALGLTEIEIAALVGA